MHKAHRRARKDSETILLVDDESELRQLVKTIVVSKGYRVLTAGDGKQAMKVFSRSHSDIDLVLTDIALPKLGGDLLIEKMRKIEPDIKVIFAGGYLEQGLKSQLRKAGATDFIQKPQPPAKILAKIRHALK